MDSAAAASRDRIILEQRELLASQARLIAELQAAVERLEGRVRELEAGGGKPKGMPGNKVEPEKPPGPRGPRRKRDADFARRRTPEPDARVLHAVEACPGCGMGLTHGSVWRTREVIDIPVVPATVTEHVYIERRCAGCGRRARPAAGLGGVAVGKGRLGVRLLSLIACLRERAAMPVRTIRWYLGTFHGLRLSDGAIVGALRSVAGAGRGEVAGVLADVRASPVANGDETGWREGGRNGYAWAFATPTERYFVRGGRDRGVLERALGLGEPGGFRGVLVSDFYAAYDRYGGDHQRCWVHLLRDLRELAEGHPGDEGVRAWADGVARLYRKARLYARLPSSRHREAARLRFERDLLALCRPHLGDGAAPQRTLAKRLDRHEGEMFRFVSDEGVPPDNNAAERAIRPLVTARKIGGGTRSPAGTETKMALATLFGTWAARGLDPHHECLHMLGSPQV